MKGLVTTILVLILFVSFIGLSILSQQSQRATPKVIQKQKIIEDVKSPTLSPDGKALAFADGQGLWLMDLETKKKGLIYPHKMLFGVPIWSPDGKKLVVVAEPDATSVLIKIKESKQQVIGRRCVSYTRAPQISWSPDSKKIAWIQDNQREIFIGTRVYYTYTGQKKSTKEIMQALDLVVSTVEPRIAYRVIRPGVISVSEVQWSPNGDLLAVIGQGKYLKRKGVFWSNRLGFLSPDGNGLHFVDSGDESIYNLCWAPDGKKIAYCKGGPGPPPNIWKIEREGNRKELIFDQERIHVGRITGLQWSPDGSGLLFQCATTSPFIKAGAPSGVGGLHWISADGRNYKRLLEGGFVSTVKWLKTDKIICLSDETLWQLTLNRR